MTKTIKVVKTDRLNQKKLQRIARRYHLAPIVIRELQLGYTEELEEHVALKMIQAGLVQKAKKKDDGPRSMQDKVASRIVLAEDTVTVDDPDDTVTAENEPIGIQTADRIDDETDDADDDDPVDNEADRGEENFIE